MVILDKIAYQIFCKRFNVQYALYTLQAEPTQR